jgi:hypothetical protein
MKRRKRRKLTEEHLTDIKHLLNPTREGMGSQIPKKIKELSKETQTEVTKEKIRRLIETLTLHTNMRLKEVGLQSEVTVWGIKQEYGKIHNLPWLVEEGERELKWEQQKGDHSRLRTKLLKQKGLYWK